MQNKTNKNNKRVQEIAKRASEVLDKLEAMKALYAEADKLTEELLQLGVTKVEVDGSTLMIVDNFASKNTYFKTTSIKRFELKKVG
jgi:hypothetical protein